VRLFIIALAFWCQILVRWWTFGQNNSQAKREEPVISLSTLGIGQSYITLIIYDVRIIMKSVPTPFVLDLVLSSLFAAAAGSNPPV
jgi:hypothetical protein